MSSRKPGYPECPAVPRGVIGVTSAVLHPRPPPPIKKPTPKLEDKKRVVPAIRNVPRKCKPLKTKSEQPSLRSKPVKNSRSLSRLDRGPIQGLELAEYKDDNLKDIGYLKIRPSEDLSDVKRWMRERRNALDIIRNRKIVREKKTILEMVGGVGVHRMPVEDNMWKTDWKEEEPKKMKKVTKPQALQAAQLGARYKLLQTQKPLSKLPLTLARRPLGVPKRDCTHAVGDRPSETLRMVPQKLQTLKKPAPRQIADPKVLLKVLEKDVKKSIPKRKPKKKVSNEPEAVKAQKRVVQPAVKQLKAVPGEHPQVKDRQKAAPPKKRPPGVPAKETSGALKKEPKMPAKKAVPTELRHKKRKTSRVKVPTGAQTVDPQDWDRFGDKFTKRIAKYILDAPTNPDLQEANQHRRGPIKGRQSKEMRRRGAASSEEEDYWALGPFRDEAEDTRKSAVVEDAAERKRPAVLERSRKNASKKPSQELENKPKKKSHKTKHLGPRLPERETGVDDQGHFLGGGPRNTNMRDIRA